MFARILSASTWKVSRCRKIGAGALVNEIPEAEKKTRNTSSPRAPTEKPNRKVASGNRHSITHIFACSSQLRSSTTLAERLDGLAREKDREYPPCASAARNQTLCRSLRSDFIRGCCRPLNQVVRRQKLLLVFSSIRVLSLASSHFNARVVTLRTSWRCWPITM